MSWMLKLYETYENCKNTLNHVPSNGRNLILPVAHTFIKAHLEISIDEFGKFKHAQVIDVNNVDTIVPCTEESASRTNSSAPHPLCDKLQYVASDYKKYVDPKKSYFDDYKKVLQDWCDSQFAHWKAIAVLRYVQKETVIKDLIDYKILITGEDGKLLNKIDRIKYDVIPQIFNTLKNVKQTDCVVRWRVERPGDPNSAVWTDKSLFDSWLNYYNSSIANNKLLCYVTGKEQPFSTKHPKFIRFSGDSAKLISSNDDKNFTYRGKFRAGIEACVVSFDVTQKAHNALRWLISKQGYKNDTQVIVAWATSGDQIPNPASDTFSLCGLDDVYDDKDDKSLTYTAQQFAEKFNKYLAGYSTKLGDTEDIIVMGLDSASPGRMSVTFYRELSGSDFLNRLDKWHKTCYWVHNYRRIESENNKKTSIRVRFYGAPAPKDIAKAAYGEKVSDSLSKATVERILPCIIDGRKIPRDIVESAVRRASNRASLDYYEWEKTLTIACALFNKYKEKEEYSVALDTDRRSRDYLYGRLLALADGLEKWALGETGENRLTNAERLMQRFADSPYTTWRTIELSLTPYKSKLGRRSIKYSKIMQEIMDKFDPNDFISNRKLSGEFLLGYHCQLSSLYGVEELVSEDE